ncbi:hypothetical protein [Hydrogenophaga sp.]|uniref:hypothetical protein n=2 Tax=Hydrogenophaga sp. TaxID=1904254 RepID=UPI003D0F8C5B
MDKQFILYHDACWRLRQLLIAVQCLQDDIACRTTNQAWKDVEMLLPLLEDIQLKSVTIANIMHQFAGEVQSRALDIRFNQAYVLIESSCHELLNAVQSVGQSSSMIAQSVLHDPTLAQGFDEIGPYIEGIRKCLNGEPLAG